MAENLNVVALTGNLTRDPELRSTPSGTSVVTLRIAVNAREKIRDEWQERANYFDVTVWGRMGENCAEYLSKGRPVAIQGRLRWEEWEAQDGGKRQAVKIVADRVQFLNSKGDKPAEQRESDLPADTRDMQPAAAGGGAGRDDDIPF